MTLCFLGAKKRALIERLIGREVRQACVRGGWEHYWASVTLADGRDLMVNYRTGEIASSRFEGMPPSKAHIVIGPGQTAVPTLRGA